MLSRNRIIPAYAGCTKHHGIHPCCPPGIIPAYAGCTRPAGRRVRFRQDHPHLRGVHYAAHATAIQAGGSSPLTRGARDQARCSRARVRIIPAYAGCTFQVWETSFHMSDHPRLRGVHSAPVLEVDLSSRIIPAYAGCTESLPPLPQFEQDHPRLRGVHATATGENVSQDGSSPLTRGAHCVT